MNAETISKLVNEERAVGLRYNPLLSRSAQAKADNMVCQGFFEHSYPNGSRFSADIDNSGYRYSYAGENLAIAYESEEELVDAWMKSEPHMRNILDNRFSEYGIGIAEKPNGTVLVAMHFAEPALPPAVPVVSTCIFILSMFMLIVLKSRHGRP